MLSQKEPGEHYKPQIERWLVGIGFPLKCKGEHVAVLDCLVSYLEVPELVVRAEVPQDHHRQQAEGDQDECYDERMLIHLAAVS